MNPSELLRSRILGFLMSQAMRLFAMLFLMTTPLRYLLLLVSLYSTRVILTYLVISIESLNVNELGFTVWIAFSKNSYSRSDHFSSLISNSFITLFRMSLKKVKISSSSRSSNYWVDLYSSSNFISFLFYLFALDCALDLL